MGVDDFWALIDVLDGQARDVRPLLQVLEEGDPRRVVRFSDALARCLHELDRFEFFEQPVAEPGDAAGAVGTHLSDDGFLYARCALIAAGRQRYEQVLTDPQTFGGIWDTDGEALLDVAAVAWQRLTGTEWAHEDPVPVETGSNPDGGWPDEGAAVDADLDPVMLNLGGTAARMQDGRLHYNSATRESLLITGPQVHTEASALIRDHGGWPPPIAYMVIRLKPANYWDLAIRRDSGLLDQHSSDRSPDGTGHGQRYVTGTVMVNKDEERTWEVVERLRALRAVVAHVLAAEMTRADPNHGALPTLRSQMDDGRHLVPGLPD